MMLLFGITAVALLWWLGKTYTRTDPKALAKAVRTIGGVAALGAAVWVGVKGQPGLAILIGGLGAWALGWNFLNIPGPWSRLQPLPGRFSRIRSAMIEMEIDHGNGAIEGSILVGAFAGRRLSSLDPQSLRRLYDECSAHDPQGVPLLEAYLDRRFAGWRENAQGDRDTRTRTHAQSGVMTKEEAYQILGLQPGAGLEEIRKAHRTLMKRLHPDHGGTAYLAARVNEAREVLLGRHR